MSSKVSSDLNCSVILRQRMVHDLTLTLYMPKQCQKHRDDTKSAPYTQKANMAQRLIAPYNTFKGANALLAQNLPEEQKVVLLAWTICRHRKCNGKTACPSPQKKAFLQKIKGVLQGISRDWKRNANSSPIAQLFPCASILILQ